MKDATGELSMTAVAVVAIAGLAGVFGALIWPQLKTQIASSTYCSQAFECAEAKCGTEVKGMQCMCYCDKDDPSCSKINSVNCPINNKLGNGSSNTSGS